MHVLVRHPAAGMSQPCADTVPGGTAYRSQITAKWFARAGGAAGGAGVGNQEADIRDWEGVLAQRVSRSSVSCLLIPDSRQARWPKSWVKNRRPALSTRTLTPVSVKVVLRMLARWSGELIQPLTTSAAPS